VTDGDTVQGSLDGKSRDVWKGYDNPGTRSPKTVARTQHSMAEPEVGEKSRHRSPRARVVRRPDA